ncbi:hypothetical protein B5C34_00035 [Pacificimonas flava]|uniref:Uncharacterized protein n=2 Tax=Pacificimonas TaxID=1960290 RepID=A0A219B1C7_9SPHN|nr:MULTISPECIES: three component ABC system middle component [Pacificimonas]MBZ6380032.1 hypothetical protein [Pacificimonas aurantium]OWV32004.1 hypothetical protein B5C34_00035 [Pacificimonas flava]
MTPETLRLLNPAFLATVIGHAATGYVEHRDHGLPFAFAFIVPPLVLHKDTRVVLPKMITSKLPDWAHKNSAELAFLPDHARELRSAVRSAILIGVHFDIIRFDERARMRASSKFNPKTARPELRKSDEVKEIMNKSRFVGRWLSVSGNQPTVLSILGIGI